jgi:hypothetical protein
MNRGKEGGAGGKGKSREGRYTKRNVSRTKRMNLII